MNMSRKKLFALCLLLAVAAFSAALQAQTSSGDERQDPVVIRSVKGNFDTVWEDLKIVLAGRGLVVSGVSHVQKMLDRTGKALGRTKKIFARAKVLEFCSAVVSRDMMEENPHFIAFCPYQIAVYAIAGHEGKVYLSYRRLVWNDGSGKAARDEVEKLLDGIVGDVVEMNKE
ncbi:MAG: DUF302 domain-containing protein [Candidatus Sulfobium sp.]|jgi:uncharacterized protein (DUF302 family)